MLVCTSTFSHFSMFAGIVNELMKKYHAAEEKTV